MPGPARAGLFIYAVDAPRLAAFYEAVAGMRQLHQADGLWVLESPDIQLLVHAIPAPIAAQITLTTPPQRREDATLKFFFSVDNLDLTGVQIQRLGGALFSERWPGPGFTIANAMDTEGNVFQLRAPMKAPDA
ncbi:MAG: glyoxalase/bleomycin resistance/dioxygenase family protein [Burkholderiales bacterium]|nr:glyoxalase/bleomycin resistance/dioxygenase family protein [Burkholderiales bacterium]